MFAALPSWVNDVTLACTAIVTIIGAATAITKVVLSAIKGITTELDERIKTHLEPIETKLDDTKDRLDERDAEIDEQFRYIKGELSYNGGRSTKDLLLQNIEVLQALSKSMASLTAKDTEK